MSIAEHIAPSRCSSCGSHVPIWTPAAQVHAVHEWERKHGKPPRPSDWKRAGIGHPSLPTVKGTFGSFLNLLAAAGVRPGYYVHRWNQRKILAAMRLWAVVHGRPPRAQDLNGGQGFQYPSYVTVCKYFDGGWQHALREAGFPVTRTNRCKGCGCDREAERTAGCRPCIVRASRRPKKCVGCGTELGNYTNDCAACKERRRVHARKAEPVAFPLARVTTGSDRKKVAA